MHRKDVSYWKLFLSTLTLSAFTFGGGYVIVPLMRKRYVEEYEWLEDDEMIDIIALAQSAPGPIAVNSSLLVGYRMAKLRGALICLLGTALPSFILISIITLFYTAFRDSVIINAALRGIRAAVAAVIVDAVITLGKTAFSKEKLFPAFVLAGALVLSFVLEFPVAVILLLASLTGWIATRIRDKNLERKAGENR